MQTTTPTELQSQIEKLTNEFNFKQMISQVLPDIKTLAFLTGHNNDKKRLIATCKNPTEFKTVLSLFPATNKHTVIGTERDSYYVDLPTPFNIKIDNPASPNQWHSFAVKISYISNDIDIQCELPIACINDYVRTDERAITDSEYHYFTGYSHQKLTQMRVRQYNFKSTQISWYGGDKTLTNADMANNIVSELIKP